MSTFEPVFTDTFPICYMHRHRRMQDASAQPSSLARFPTVCCTSGSGDGDVRCTYCIGTTTIQVGYRHTGTVPVVSFLQYHVYSIIILYYNLDCRVLLSVACLLSVLVLIVVM